MKTEVKVTFIRVDAAMILDVEIGEGSMNMCAYFLACFRRPEYANDRYLRSFMKLRRPDIVSQLRVITRCDGLVMVDAVEPDSKQVHIGMRLPSGQPG